jgi:hypothetical protein
MKRKNNEKPNRQDQPTRSIDKNYGYSWEIAPNNQHDTRQPFAILSK